MRPECYMLPTGVGALGASEMSKLKYCETFKSKSNILSHRGKILSSRPI